MPEQGAYGESFGSRFGISHSPVITTRALRNSLIAVTDVQVSDPDFGRTLPIPTEEAYLVHLLLEDCPRHELYLDGKQVPQDPFTAGVTGLYDLMRSPTAEVQSACRFLSFYLPFRALDEIASDVGHQHIRQLNFRHGKAYDDPVMRNIAACVLPALERPAEANKLFVDHIAFACRAHVARTYGQLETVRPPARGGLAPWQQRRAEEFLSANIDGDVGLADLAKECGLSVSYFTRAFRQATGTPPHRWLVERRVDKAKGRLRESSMQLSEIAFDCGFADQSHFTRTFTRVVGMSPGAWRRMRKR
jgi:AraC family transcriptional regulator